jgi:lysophospholipase L1-like esterase
MGSSKASAAESRAADVPFRKILCFGDSITYGVTLQASSLPPGAQSDLVIVEGYIPKLWRLLESKYGSGFELVNAGVPGERSDEGVDRIRRELRTHQPELVLLLEGVLDVNNESPRFRAARENLGEMMDLSERAGALVVIGTYPLLNPEGFRADGAENVLHLNEIIREEAAAREVTVADHETAVVPGGQGPDGLHPNNLGYEEMAATWLTAIEALSARLAGT